MKNYHLDRTFFQSQIVDGEFFPKKEYRVDGKKIGTITALYKLLLEKGWSEETCFDAEWNPNNPSIGQSPATALLFRKYLDAILFAMRGKNRCITSIELPEKILT